MKRIIIGLNEGEKADKARAAGLLSMLAQVDARVQTERPFGRTEDQMDACIRPLLFFLKFCTALNFQLK